MLGNELLESCFSSMVDVDLILFVIKVITILVIGTHSMSSCFGRGVAVSTVLATTTSRTSTSRVTSSLRAGPCVGSVGVVAHTRNARRVGRVLNTSFLSIFRIGPIPISVRLRVSTGCVSASDLAIVRTRLRRFPVVRSIICRRSLMRLLGTGLRHVKVITTMFITLLLFVSIMLVGGAIELGICSGEFAVRAVHLINTAGKFVAHPFMKRTFFRKLLTNVVTSTNVLNALCLMEGRFCRLFSLFSTCVLTVTVKNAVILNMFVYVVSASMNIHKVVSLAGGRLCCWCKGVYGAWGGCPTSYRQSFDSSSKVCFVSKQ